MILCLKFTIEKSHNFKVNQVDIFKKVKYVTIYVQRGLLRGQ